MADMNVTSPGSDASDEDEDQSAFTGGGGDAGPVQSQFGGNYMDSSGTTQFGTDNLVAGSLDPQTLEQLSKMGWGGSNPINTTPGQSGTQDFGPTATVNSFSDPFKSFMGSNNITAKQSSGVGNSYDLGFSQGGKQIGNNTNTNMGSDEGFMLAAELGLGGAAGIASAGAGAGAAGTMDAAAASDAGGGSIAAAGGGASPVGFSMGGANAQLLDPQTMADLGDSGGMAGKSSADLSSLYSNAGYGSTGSDTLSNIGWGAAKGGGINAGLTAARGGDASDILKSGAIGALGGGVAAGVSAYNPAGELGVNDPTAAGAINKGAGGLAGSLASGGNPLLGAASGAAGGAVQGYNPAANVGLDGQMGKYFNNALSSGASALATGQNPTSNVLGSAATSGLSVGLQAGNGALNTMGNNTNTNDDSWDFGSNAGSAPSEGTGMPSYGNGGGMSIPSSSNPMSGYLNSPSFSSNPQPQQNTSTPTNWDPSSTVNSQGGFGTSPQQSNPVKAMASSFGGGASGSGGGSSPSSFDNMAGNLLQLYQSHKNAGAYGGLANNLSSLYSPNSAYAQQMNNALTRSDAASGRRSQVGARQVQLQAALANVNSQNAPRLQSLYSQQQNNQGAELQALMRMGMGGPNGGGMFSQGMQGLQSLFPSGGGNGMPTVPGYSPSQNYGDDTGNGYQPG